MKDIKQKSEILTISHDKIFKIMSARGRRYRNENFLISSTSLSFIKKNIALQKNCTINTNQESQTNESTTTKIDILQNYAKNNTYFGIKTTKKNFKKAVDRNSIKRKIRVVLKDFLKTLKYIDTLSIPLPKAASVRNASCGTQSSVFAMYEDSSIGETKQFASEVEFRNFNPNKIAKRIHNLIVIVPLSSCKKLNFSTFRQNLLDLLDKSYNAS